MIRPKSSNFILMVPSRSFTLSCLTSKMQRKRNRNLFTEQSTKIWTLSFIINVRWLAWKLQKQRIDQLQNLKP